MKHTITIYKVDSIMLEQILFVAKWQLSDWMNKNTITKETWQDTYNEILKIQQYMKNFKNSHYYLCNELSIF